MFDFDDIKFAIGAFITVFLLVGALLQPIVYFTTKGEIQEYYALKSTIQEARKTNINEIERAALINKIAENNEALASNKYWNNTIFDFYFPDEIDKLEPLK